MAKVSGILETAIYVDDLSRSAAFYRRLFGFETLLENERIVALNVADRNVLLLFPKGASTSPTVLPGGVIPPHDGSGQLHFAFSIASEDVGPWRERLRSKGVEVESVVTWPRGGTSLYFRDPDGHCVELISPGWWTIY